MSVVVKNRNVGISPHKVRKVCDMIRRKKAEDAIKTLRFLNKKEISIMLTKLINSGLAIAESSAKYDLGNLVISKICVDEGPTVKRFQPRAQGRAFQILKRSSHIILELKEA
ncbi:MAG: 50S ribosomal protein L22 [Bacteriovoracaceae bacterium]|nr:50S ribosomal protein L22 [Bacteriovoracaceae bacterium]